jgi:hypothetical protein
LKCNSKARCRALLSRPPAVKWRRSADTEHSFFEEAPTKSNDWGTEPNATWYDLKQLGFAVLLFELVVAALAYATRVFFGVRTALWVGFGIGTLVLVAFVLIALFGVFTHTIAAFLARREMRRRQNR